MFAEGFSIDSIVQPLADEAKRVDVKSRLGLLFIDFIPLKREGNQPLNEIKGYCPNCRTLCIRNRVTTRQENTL